VLDVSFGLILIRWIFFTFGCQDVLKFSKLLGDFRLYFPSVPRSVNFVHSFHQKLHGLSLCSSQSSGMNGAFNFFPFFLASSLFLGSVALFFLIFFDWSLH
jgi:hypothetical protein